MVPGGIAADIPETNIQCEQSALFELTPPDEPRIITSLQVLVPNSYGIVTMFPEEFGNFWMEVFVGFDAHHGAPRGTNLSLASSAA